LEQYHVDSNLMLNGRNLLQMHETNSPSKAIAITNQWPYV